MEKSSFFDAELLGFDESNNPIYDREFNSADFAKYFSSFIGNGVFPNPATCCQITSIDSNMQITLQKGKAWINGYFYQNTDDLKLQLDVADGVLHRIDRVVLRLDYLNREIKAYIKKGEFASKPVAPTLQRDSDMYELGIADIRVNAGIIKINQSDIIDLRLNKDICGVVHGTVNQVDASEIFRQYQAWFGEKSVGFEADFKAFLTDLRTQLDGDVAGNLLNKIMTVEDKLANMVTGTPYAIATGTNNTFIVSSPTIKELVEGMSITIKVPEDFIWNGSMPTLNWDNKGAKPIKMQDGRFFKSFIANGIYTFVYDGSCFILQGNIVSNDKYIVCVDPVNGDDTNDGVYPRCVKTIGKGLELLPKISSAYRRLEVLSGSTISVEPDAPQVIYTIEGFIGGELDIYLNGVTLNNICFALKNNSTAITFSNGTINLTSTKWYQTAIQISKCSTVYISGLKVNGGYNGIYSYLTSSIVTSSCILNNITGQCITSIQTNSYVLNTTGTGNNIGFISNASVLFMCGGNTIASKTRTLTTNSGQIFGTA